MGRRGTAKSLSKKPEELVEDVEAMAEKAGIELPKEPKKRRREVKEAVTESSKRSRREPSKQEALKTLKDTHKTGKPKGKGDPYSQAERKTTRQKRGVNAPPDEEERKKPPTRRKTKAGKKSAMSNVVNEANRSLADALYELAEFVLHGDATQKGLSYQRAARSVREAPDAITSKEEAMKLTGVGKSVGEKIDQFLKNGKIDVLEEYRSGERGM